VGRCSCAVTKRYTGQDTAAPRDFDQADVPLRVNRVGDHRRDPAARVRTAPKADAIQADAACREVPIGSKRTATNDVPAAVSYSITSSWIEGIRGYGESAVAGVV
jgi:hypothetical protein